MQNRISTGFGKYKIVKILGKYGIFCVTFDSVKALAEDTILL